MYKGLIREKYGQFLRKEGKAKIILKNILELERDNKELGPLFEPSKAITKAENLDRDYKVFFMIYKFGFKIFF